ncbi:hypothetical protein RND81_03G184900 [Saponaria officinalis]|uniref:poly(A)-specific ribonuclease n=1 Tax=Saponaria officinalis TaxID=3572 RepID=A0AAW1M147_SAPOF
MNSHEFRCEIIPIPTSSPSDVPKHALFFHRFCEEGAEFAPGSGTSRCPIHHSKVGTVECIRCIENGSMESQNRHQSNKRFHVINNHPYKLVSWFDERIEVVVPRCRNWINRVGSCEIFVPVADNVGFSFKLGPASLDHKHDAFYAKDVIATQLSIQRLNLLHRCLVPLVDLNQSDKIGITTEFSDFGSFSVLSYNILSDIYLYPDKYFYCPQWALRWEYRRKNLLHEILLYDADIVCLQEVQSDHFENFFKPELAKYGYLAVYKKKTKEVFTGNGYTIDGCATFFRSDTFNKVIAYELEFSKTALSLIGKLEPSLRDQARVRLIKDNIALVVILEMVGNASSQAPSWSRLCVVNTHIFASKGSPDVKLLQISDLINEIEKTTIIDPRMPLFICGDINSIPGSDPYTLLAKGEVNPACGEEAIDPLGIHPHLKLRHSMNLASAYTASVKPTKDKKRERMNMRERSIGEPSFTGLTPHRQRTLDYIFHTVDNLEVKGLLELPDIVSVGGTLPSPLCSSDHIALMVKFKISRPFLG